jgi:hypothetical protein
MFLIYSVTVIMVCQLRCNYDDLSIQCKHTKAVCSVLEKTCNDFHKKWAPMTLMHGTHDEQLWNIIHNELLKYDTINFTKLFIEIVCLTGSDSLASRFLSTYIDKIDINSSDTNSSKSSPIMFVIRKQLTNTIKLLVEQFQCDLNYKDCDGYSVESYAIQLFKEYLYEHHKQS